MANPLPPYWTSRALHPTKTSLRVRPGILYADIGVDLSNILVEDMPILGMFSRIMMETGTSEMDRVQLSRRIGSQTGGVYATFLADQPSAGGAVADPAALKQYLFLRGKVSPVRWCRVGCFVFVFLFFWRWAEGVQQHSWSLHGRDGGSSESFGNEVLKKAVDVACR